MTATPFGRNDLFVAPHGSDAWSGRRPEPSADKTDGPLATINEARRRIRSAKGLQLSSRQTPTAVSFGQSLTVWLRDGRYALEEPIVFEPCDSGPVTYAAYPGEEPILDGGRPISGWQTTQVNGVDAWYVDLPEVCDGKLAFRQLFVNGERRLRPRWPREGLAQVEAVPGMPETAGWGTGGYTQFICAEGDVQCFTNLGDVEIVYFHWWIEERSFIAAFCPETRLVTLSRPSRAPLMGTNRKPLPYFLDNVFEALTEPGQWYLNRTTGRLYYIPKPGETIAGVEVYAPVCQQLVGLVGDAEAQEYVEYLGFQGLTFEHTDWRHPDASDDACSLGPAHPTARARHHRRGLMAAAAQAACDVPGVIFLEAARYCRFEDCTIRHIGWYGLEIADGCWGVQVVGNRIRDMGAGGIKVGGGSAQDPPYLSTGGHRISDNHISAGGRVFYSGVGILSMHAYQIAIQHNHIHDLYYTGISCGWEWGYQSNISRNNRIEKNHIHAIGQGLLSDMGGIYTLGVQPGTVIRGNLVYDVTMAEYGGWCIYPDEGSSHLVIEENLCFGSSGEAFHQHYGRENLVRNNIFALCANAQIAHGRADPDHQAFLLERNIILTYGRPVFSAGYGVRLKECNHRSDLNLIWDLTGEPLSFVGSRRHDEGVLDYGQWQELGQDGHSLNADPGFRDPLAGDFSLAPDSPAFSLGFRALDLSDVGPRRAFGKDAQSP